MTASDRQRLKFTPGHLHGHAATPRLRYTFQKLRDTLTIGLGQRHRRHSHAPSILGLSRHSTGCTATDAAPATIAVSIQMNVQVIILTMVVHLKPSGLDVLVLPFSPRNSHDMPGCRFALD